MRAAFGAVLIVLAAGCGASDGVVELTAGLANVRRHAIGFDGEAYAVVWTSSDGGPTTDRLYFARITGSGALETAPTAVVDVAISIGELVITPGGGNYVVWYRAADDANAQLTAAVIDPAGDLIAGPQDLGALAGLGTTFGATWADDRFAVASVQSSPTGAAVNLATYDLDLAPIAGTVVESSTSDQREPSVTWSATAHDLVVAWTEQERIRAAHATLDAIPAAASAVGDLGAGEFGPVAGTDKVGAVVGWSEGTTDDRRRFGFAAATPDGWRLIPGLVPDNRYAPVSPSIATRAGHATIAWTSDADTALPEIVVGQVDIAAGTAMTGIDPVSSARWPYQAPRLAAGADEVGLAFTGAVDGADRLYFVALE